MRRLSVLACAAALAAPLRAQELPSCLASSSTKKDPATAADLIACQRIQEKKFLRRWEEKHREIPPDRLIERLDEHKRAEVRTYLGRHPDRASVDFRKIMGHDAAPAPPQNDQDDGKMMREYQPVKGLSEKEQDTKRIEHFLLNSKDGGKAALSPEMGKAAVKALQSNQKGGLSPDMQEFLKVADTEAPSIGVDGMERVKGAALKAKEAAMDLDTDSSIKEHMKNQEKDADSP